MPVPSVITDLSVIAASNSPAGSDSIGTSLDDYLRSVQAIVKREQSQGAAIASSATTAIGGNTDGNYLHITGTTTITSFGTVAAGISRTVVFDGALTLTNSASLILPGGANITTVAGDAAEFVSEGGGIWRCSGYLRSAGQYIFNGQTATVNLAGNLNLSGSGGRITGDFSNATIANRVMFQTSTSGGNTSFGLLPHPSNATPITTFEACLSSDPAITNVLQCQITQTDARLNSGSRGGASYLPMTFYTSGSERMRIDTSGNVLVTGSGGLGYSAGSGGTVTQATSKSTAVTLNKPTGQITMNNAALAAATTVGFQIANSLISTSDILYVAMVNGGVGSPANYRVKSSCGAGAALIYVTNESGGSLSDAIVLQFAIIKGAIA